MEKIPQHEITIRNSNSTMEMEISLKISRLPTLRDEDSPRPEFLCWSNTRAGLTCHYAPFDYLNPNAKLILVGITPGGTQMNRALNAARIALSPGTPIYEAIRHVKREGSFSGAMRSNIVATLNRLGYQRKLNISCANSLWNTDDHLVHFCSLLKYPVFLKGKDYNGKPAPTKNPELFQMLRDHFVPDMQALPHDAMLVPLGDTVLDTVVELKEQGLIPQSLMTFEGRYVAPPHPSGANAESIALLMEPHYPTKNDYEERMYCDYMQRAPWKRKGGKPQLEAKYKAVRAARWQSVLFIRRAYGIL
jgi:hypothetical protein